MKICYKNTLNDLVAFQKYHYSHNDVLKKRQRWGTVYMPLVYFVLMIIFYLLNGSPEILVWGSVFIVIYSILIRRAYTSGVEKIVRQLHKSDSKEFLCEHVLEITEEGVRETTDFYEHKHKWEGVPRIAVDGDYVFIYVRSNEAYTVPRKNIFDGDFDAFVEMAKFFWEKRVTVARPVNGTD